MSLKNLKNSLLSLRSVVDVCISCFNTWFDFHKWINLTISFIYFRWSNWSAKTGIYFSFWCQLFFSQNALSESCWLMKTAFMIHNLVLCNNYISISWFKKAVIRKLLPLNLGPQMIWSAVFESSKMKFCNVLFSLQIVLEYINDNVNVKYIETIYM